MKLSEIKYDWRQVDMLDMDVAEIVALQFDFWLDLGCHRRQSMRCRGVPEAGYACGV